MKKKISIIIIDSDCNFLRQQIDTKTLLIDLESGTIFKQYDILGCLYDSYKEIDDPLRRTFFEDDYWRTFDEDPDYFLQCVPSNLSLSDFIKFILKRNVIDIDIISIQLVNL